MAPVVQLASNGPPCTIFHLEGNSRHFLPTQKNSLLHQFLWSTLYVTTLVPCVVEHFWSSLPLFCETKIGGKHIWVHGSREVQISRLHMSLVCSSSLGSQGVNQLFGHQSLHSTAIHEWNKHAHSLSSTCLLFPCCLLSLLSQIFMFFSTTHSSPPHCVQHNWWSRLNNILQEWHIVEETWLPSTSTEVSPELSYLTMHSPRKHRTYN